MLPYTRCNLLIKTATKLIGVKCSRLEFLFDFDTLLTIFTVFSRFKEKKVCFFLLMNIFVRNSCSTHTVLNIMEMLRRLLSPSLCVAVVVSFTYLLLLWVALLLLLLLCLRIRLTLM